MPSELEKFKNCIDLHPVNKQIIIINHQIDTLESFEFRTGSKERINKRYSTIKYLKSLRNNIFKDPEINKIKNTFIKFIIPVLSFNMLFLNDFSYFIIEYLLLTLSFDPVLNLKFSNVSI